MLQPYNFFLIIAQKNKNTKRKAQLPEAALKEFIVAEKPLQNNLIPTPPWQEAYS